MVVIFMPVRDLVINDLILCIPICVPVIIL